VPPRLSSRMQTKHVRGASSPSCLSAGATCLCPQTCARTRRQLLSSPCCSHARARPHLSACAPCTSFCPLSPLSYHTGARLWAPEPTRTSRASLRWRAWRLNPLTCVDTGRHGGSHGLVWACEGLALRGCVEAGSVGVRAYAPLYTLQ